MISDFKVTASEVLSILRREISNQNIIDQEQFIQYNQLIHIYTKYNEPSKTIERLNLDSNIWRPFYRYSINERPSAIVTYNILP